MRVKTIILSAAAALLLAQCNQNPATQSRHPNTFEPNETTSFANLSSDVLIDLPESIAADPFKEKNLGKAAINARPDGKIYDAIRTYIGYANSIVNDGSYGVKAMIELWRNAIDWNDVTEKSPNPVTGVLGEYTWTALYFPDKEFHYHLSVVKNTDSAQPGTIPPLSPVLTINFNGSFDFPKGRVYYNLGLLDIISSDAIEVNVMFEKNIGGAKSLDVAITGFDLEPDSDPDKIDLSLYNEDGLVHMSGSSYNPRMTNILKEVTGHCYTFTGIVDPVADKSIINLGLPPAVYDDTLELFTTYGIANIWTSLTIEQQILTYPDTIKAIIATSYTKDLTVDEILHNITAGIDILVPPETIDDMTLEEFRTFLEDNQNISDASIRADLNDLLWVMDLAQPVYLNYLGYAGNGNDVPAGFNYLSNVSIVPDAKTPSETAGLSFEP